MLQRFLSTVNYYRSYLCNMAEMAEPLFRLTRKGTPWNRTADCQLAFDALRQALANDPVVLRYPRWGQHSLWMQIEQRRYCSGPLSTRPDHRCITANQLFFIGAERDAGEIQRRTNGGMDYSGCNTEVAIYVVLSAKSWIKGGKMRRTRMTHSPSLRPNSVKREKSHRTVQESRDGFVC